MTPIIKRNLRIFFRNRSAVFFSILSVLLVFGLYVLFLGDNASSQMDNIKDARFIMDSWMIAGLLSVSSFTTTMGAFSIMVDDREKKILKDFTTAPITRAKLTASYIVSSCFIGILLSLIAFILGEAYIVTNGGNLLPFTSMLEILGLIILAVFSGSSLLFFGISFIKSQTVYGTVSTVVGTLAGFLIGVYVPIGALPSAVRTLIMVFPVSHSAVLFRQVMMEKPLAAGFANLPAGARDELQKHLGVVYYAGSHPIPTWVSFAVLGGTLVIFYALAIMSLSRKSK